MSFFLVRAGVVLRGVMSRKSEQETEKAQKRLQVEAELHQMVVDFAHLVTPDQPKYTGARGEPMPQVSSVEETATPRNVVFACNFTSDHFVPNAHTIGQSVSLDGNVKTVRAVTFLGMLLDTIGLTHASTCGVTDKVLKPAYRSKSLFGKAATSMLSTPKPTVCGYMEAIRLPRDLYNEDFDMMYRLWFAAVESPNHVTENYNCAPMKLMFDARLTLKEDSYARGEALSWGADEAMTLRDYANFSKDYYQCPEDYDNIESADFKVNLGVLNPLVSANPFSKWFSTKDRPNLREGLEWGVLQLRDRVIANANNTSSYFQEDEVLGRVFRPHAMHDFFKLPGSVLDSADVSLLSQKLYQVKTPRGLEETMPQHVKMSDTHILLHRRASNKRHYVNLRERLPICNHSLLEPKQQNEWVTPDGYWVLYLPSTVKRRDLCRTKSLRTSQIEFIWDVLNNEIDDQSVHFSRYDKQIPRPAGRPTPQEEEDSGGLSDAHVSDEEDEIDRIMNGTDGSSGASGSVSPTSEDEWGSDPVPLDDSLSTRWNEFLLGVDRFVKGCVGNSENSVEVPAFTMERDERGDAISLDEHSSKETVRGGMIITPYFPDWVEAMRASGADESRLDPIARESRKQRRNYRVTAAVKQTKLLLAKSGFQTRQLGQVAVGCVYKRNRDGTVCMEPVLDEDGGCVLNDDGTRAEQPEVLKEFPVCLGVHFARPKKNDPMYKQSCKVVKKYCANEIPKESKRLPILDEISPKYNNYIKEWKDGKFSDDIGANAPSRCWWHKPRHTRTSNRNHKLYIENGITNDVRGLSTGPDKTRAEYSVTQATHIHNTIMFRNGEMGNCYLKDLGRVHWVNKVAKSTNAEYYIKNAIQPWFDETYELNQFNEWVVKPTVTYPEISRLDPDHDFASVWETIRHAVFDHIGSVYNQYKYCHLVYCVFGTAFHKPHSSELSESSNSTAACLQFVGGTETGKSHKCSHVLCCFNKDRHVIDNQGNSALCGIGVLFDDQECAMSYSDECNMDKDAEALRQEKQMKTQGYIARGRSLKKMCADGVERYITDKRTNRTNVAQVACVNEEAKGGENVKANENRSLKIYAEAAKVAFFKPKDMHGARCRNLKDAILAKHFEDPKVTAAGKRVLHRMVENTERIAAFETFLTTIGSPQARAVDMITAHLRFSGIANFLSEKGVVWNDRPRLYDTMLKLSRFQTVELAILAAFEGQRRPDGSKIPGTPRKLLGGFALPVLPGIHRVQDLPILRH